MAGTVVNPQIDPMAGIQGHIKEWQDYPSKLGMLLVADVALGAAYSYFVLGVRDPAGMALVGATNFGAYALSEAITLDTHYLKSFDRTEKKSYPIARAIGMFGSGALLGMLVLGMDSMNSIIHGAQALAANEIAFKPIFNSKEVTVW